MKILSEEHKKKISESCKKSGCGSWMLGKKHTLATRVKMSITHLGNPSNRGRKLSPEHVAKMREVQKGQKHWNWKGGITSENHLLRNSFESKKWREAVFNRDGFKCKINNSDCVHEIHAHHILRFADYPELRFDINNGITLCENHHPMKKVQELKLVPFFQSLISTKMTSSI